MFGHQDNNQPMDSEPTADATLTQDTTGTPADSGVPPVMSNAPSAPTVDNSSTSDFIMTEPHHTPAASDPPASAPATDPDDLLDLKQQALQQLTPLVDHLDQTPEEKFRTTMMMIQAADNQSLLKDAFEAAQNITDEKVRAQALLDVVNEINYFTQQHGHTS